MFTVKGVAAFVAGVVLIVVMVTAIDLVVNWMGWVFSTSDVLELL